MIKKATVLSIINKKGMTLVEVMVSIMILSVIVIAFFPLFTHTAINVMKSETIIDASYIAQGVLEDYYDSSRDPESSVPADSISKSWDEFGKGYWVVVRTNAEDDLVKVFVRIYSDDSETEIESQMELHLIWN